MVKKFHNLIRILQLKLSQKVKIKRLYKNTDSVDRIHQYIFSGQLLFASCTAKHQLRNVM